MVDVVAKYSILSSNHDLTHGQGRIDRDTMGTVVPPFPINNLKEIKAKKEKKKKRKKKKSTLSNTFMCPLVFLYSFSFSLSLSSRLSPLYYHSITLFFFFLSFFLYSLFPFLSLFWLLPVAGRWTRVAACWLPLASPPTVALRRCHSCRAGVWAWAEPEVHFSVGCIFSPIFCFC